MPCWARRARPSYALANLFILSIPLALFSFTFLSPFLAEDRAGAYWILRITAPALCLIGISILAVRRDAELRHYLFVILGASVVQVLGGLSLASALLLRRPSWDAPLFLKTLGFGLRTNLTTLPYQINLRIDQFFVSGLLSPSDLGQYTVAFTWSSVLSFIGGGLSVAVLARATQVSSADTSAMKALFRRFRLVCAGLVVMGALAAVLTPALLPAVFGEAFRPAVRPAVILTIAAVFLNIGLNLHELLRGFGHPGLGMRAEISGLAAGAILLPGAIRLGGLTGAAAVSLAAHAGVLALLWVLAHRKLRVPRAWWFDLKSAVSPDVLGQ